MKWRNALHSLAYSIVAWWIALALFMVIRFHGTGAQTVWKDTPGVLPLLAVTVGVVLGVYQWMTQTLCDRPSIRRRSYAFTVGLNVTLMFAALVAVSFVTRAVAAYQGKLEWSLVLLKTFSRILEPTSLGSILYIIAVSIILNMFRQVTFMTGPRVFVNLMLGRYRLPKEENRIFMFLDLKNSTTHAERLGHLRFCKLIQDCFSDLTESAIKHEVEIYQYVGDEAILTWRIPQGIRNANCLRIFFDFRDKLTAHASHYEARYEIRPEFKAGVNTGPVTVAQVGDIKRDIAYLSDVLNTAARIQKKCGELDRDLLVSGSVKDLLPLHPGIQFDSLGSALLTGKTEEVDLYAVETGTD